MPATTRLPSDHAHKTLARSGVTVSRPRLALSRLRAPQAEKTRAQPVGDERWQSRDAYRLIRCR